MVLIRMCRNPGFREFLSREGIESSAFVGAGNERNAMEQALGRNLALPIHRRLLQRKVDLWTRSKPESAPRFLEIVSDEPMAGFECPLVFEDVAGLESETQ